MDPFTIDRAAAAELLRHPRDLAVYVASLLEPDGDRRTTRIAERMGVASRTVRRSNERLKPRGWGFKSKPGRPRKKRTPRARVNRRNPDRQVSAFPPHTPPTLSKDLKRLPSVPPKPGLAELAPALAAELGEEGRKVVQSIRESWPHAYPASAAHAVRRMLDQGLTMNEAAAYFEAAPHFDGIERRTDTPWLAATARHRLEAWEPQRRAMIARLRREQSETRTPGVTKAPRRGSWGTNELSALGRAIDRGST